MTSSNVLFRDEVTAFRVPTGNRLRVVYARYDNITGEFVRYVIKRTKSEIESERAKYAPARVGVLASEEVHEWQFR